jgi:polyisoprenyl-phosphate glycosyltransferase
MKQKISIVVPVYREAGNLKLLYDELEKVTLGLSQYLWEYIFVNDGSPDNSLEVLYDLAKLNKKNKIIDLSRNFGKEIALTAGVHEAIDSDAVICIDADLQHPPETIPKLIDSWIKGAEIVATIRISTEKQPILRKIGSKLFYWVMSKISGLGMISQNTDFRLYDKKVIHSFCSITERQRIFRGIMDWMGFKTVYIEFIASARNEGQAGYSYSKLWTLALNSITSFSLVPLRLTGYLGVIITIFSGVLFVWMIINYLISSSLSYSPLAIVVVANTFFIGLVLMAIGLTALYIGTIHTEVINRPIYIVREKLNFE